MLPRHAISDADRERIARLLPGRRGRHGGVTKDDRLFIDAILYAARTGIPWQEWTAPVPRLWDRGVVLVEAQAVPARGDPLRQEGGQLPRLRHVASIMVVLR